MRPMRFSRPFILTFFLLTLLLRPAVSVLAQDLSETALKNLPWRPIGPAIMGGRIDDVAVVESDPRTIYLATAGGGLFKSINAGTTWTPLFDTQVTSSIGDVAIAPSNPDIVYVGTGEGNNRQSSSWGNGVYRSTDAGKTWTHLGLAETMHINRIVVHPSNPDVAYVAAQGRLWGPNKERGLYKTTDGGKTWTNVLAINEDTGVNDVVLDPQNPETLVASAYQRRRSVFSFLGSGPGSGLYKTTDGGKTWTKLTKGLPTGDTGRIGLDIYHKNSKILYATIENAEGGVFRSEDSGDSWVRQTRMNPRPMYFSQIRIDPNDDQKLWLLGVNIASSDDGGKNFAPSFARVHADAHALWINPANSADMLLGTDGGLQWSHDRGRTWDFLNTVPLSQFYEIAADMQKPYWVYGGLQDNGSWASPIATTDSRGPSNDEWIQINGGDGFYIQVDPSDSNTLYTESQNGSISRQVRTTGEDKSIRPRPPAGEPPYRFDWNAPMLLSPHNPKKLYFGGNRLFISNDRGDTWRRTDDLTTNPDRTKLKIMGVVPGSTPLTQYEHTMSTFGQIVTLTESPIKPGLLWVGTDDGNLQVSQDDGLTWKNVVGNVPGVPKGTYVARVMASNYAPGRAYVAFDGHRSDDFTPYLFVTEDYGATWQSLAANLPVGGTLHVIREHPRNPNLLFAGTERGLWISLDRGGKWLRFPEPLPTVPVNDILLHPRENDLILATHGRGIYVLDDIGFLEKLTEALPRNVTLFPPRPATAFRVSNRKANAGDRFYTAPNAPFGAIIQYFLKNEPDEKNPVKLTILDKSGKNVIRELANTRERLGLNRIFWDLRQGLAGPPPAPEEEEEREETEPEREEREERKDNGQKAELGLRQTGVKLASLQQQPPPTTAPTAPGTGRRQRGGGGQGQGQGNPPPQFGRRTGFGPRVLPGTYLVRLTMGSETQTYPLVVADDPRITLTFGQRKARYDAQLRLLNLQSAMTVAGRIWQAVQKQADSVPMEKAPASVKEAADALKKRLAALQTQLRSSSPPRPGGAAGGEPTATADRTSTITPLPTRLAQLNFSIDSISEPLTNTTRDEVNSVNHDVKAFLAALNTLVQNDLNSLNKLLTDNQLTPLPPLAERVPMP